MAATHSAGATPLAGVHLAPEQVVDTLSRLRDRIEERFPGSGLGRVADHLYRTGMATSARIDVVTRPPRYLDCCSELLSLNGKLAALYAQRMDDPFILAAVDDVEDLNGGFSSKIWQKIMILNAVGPGPAEA
jgi:hypothetical protein